MHQEPAGTSVSGETPDRSRVPRRTALLLRSEAARLLHVSESTVVRLGRSGSITEIRVSKRAVRIDPESVEAHIRARRLSEAA